MKKTQFCIVTSILFLISATASAQVTFTDVTEAAGLGGVVGPDNEATWGDYDNDGDADILFTTSRGSRLYRNEGDGRFVDVTQAVGITDASISTGTATFVDVDNDGHLDLFVRSGPGDVLYQNNGDGTFANVSQAAGMESVRTGIYAGAVSFDYDNDGLLDIYVARREPLDFLYHNEGNGRFREVATQIGLDKPGFSDGFALGDYDDDGDLDLFIPVPGPSGLSQGTDVLYRNEGRGVFTDMTQQAGVQRTANHSDGFFWDYDNDGDLDLFVEAIRFRDADGFNILYRNNGDGTFTDVTQPAGIALIAEGGGGAGYYGDYDNDGWLDLCITHRSTSAFLYHNNGDGSFIDVSNEVGIGADQAGSVVFVDYDNDGDLDIFISAYTGNRVALYRNNGVPNHWLQLRLVGAQSNRDAIGARVKVIAGGLSMLREVAGCSGLMLNQDRLPVHLGLRSNPQADLIEIRWPSGIIQTFTDIPTDQRLTIHEIEGLLVVVHAVFPAFGYPTGGSPVQIQGESFLPGSRVFFERVEASEAHVASPSLITAVTPPGAKGTVDVEVVGPDGKSHILKDGFRYGTLKVTRIIPEGGPVTGGITVGIEGVGFHPGAEVQIGGKNLADAFVTPILIRGTLPPGDPGAVDVSVTNPDGERDMLHRAFAYVLPPTIEGVSPTFVSLSGEIRLRGSGFIRTPLVRVGEDAAQRVDFVSSDMLDVTISIPSSFTVGPRDVTVINPDGQRAVLTDAVTVLVPIEIKSVEPASGGLEGGTRITIVGEPIVEIRHGLHERSFPSRFVKGVNVFVGGEQASYVTVQSDNVITAITPPNTPGAKDVRVINPDGQGDALRDAFIYNPLPQIARVTPDNGKLAGGTEITIQGSGFLPGARVLFSTDTETLKAASSSQVVSSTIITAITTADKPGARDVVVRNPDKQEAILPEGFTYNPLPTITNITPNNGISSGGTKVIIEGTGFLLGARVMVGERGATTMVKDDMTIEAVTPANSPGVWDVRVVNPDTQEVIMREGFVSVGELAYNFPNPFQASRGTTFRYVTDKPVQYINVKIFNMAGIPIDVVQQAGSNEVEWHNPEVYGGLYVYMMEVRLEDGKVRQFKNTLEVYE